MPYQELSFVLGDLQECNNEKIHLSGAVQAHGALILYTPADLRIQATSVNAASFLGLENKSILGERIDYIFRNELIEHILHLQKTYPWRLPGMSLQSELAGKKFDIYMYNTQGCFALEFETLDLKDPKTRPAENILQSFLAESKDSRNVTELTQLACRYIREVSGIDRVMMYKFIPPAMHGEVIAEDRVIGSHSFMHHRFPSSDIPKPARDLYLRNKVRLIPRAGEMIAAIEPAINPLTNARWDLSDSRLRSVSPIHIEYLKNMGVEGSLSFAVVVGGELWGLIACHHLSPFSMSLEKRAICSTIADLISMQVVLMENLDGHLLRSTFEGRLKKILGAALEARDPLATLMKQHVLLTEAFNVTGVALCRADGADISGVTPPVSLLKGLYPVLLQEFRTHGKPIIHYQNIRDLFPQWSAPVSVACGLMAVAVGDKNDSILVFFRPEFVKQVTWGGDPVKKLENKKFPGAINPRASFESWQETISNRSTPWNSFEVDGLQFLKEVLFDSALAKKAAIDQLTASLNSSKGKA